jgi:hypothetical protein
MPSSFGAAAAISTTPERVSTVRGSTIVPPSTCFNGCGRKRSRVDSEAAPVRRDDFAGDEAIEREAELARQPAETSAQGDAADADGRAVPEGNDQAALAEGSGDISRQRSTTDPELSRLHGRLDAAHPPEVDHHAAFNASETANAVSAAANRHLQTFGARVQQPGAHLVLVGDAGDDGRPRLMGVVIDPPRVLILSVAGA